MRRRNPRTAVGVKQTGPLGPVFFIAVLGTLLLPAPSPAQTIEEKAQLCAACHGENGIPQEKTTPVIWGQYQGYLYLELRDYKSGAHKNDIMSPLAETLAREDMMALALYFSQKRWPDLQQPPAIGMARYRRHLHGLAAKRVGHIDARPVDPGNPVAAMADMFDDQPLTHGARR